MEHWNRQTWISVVRNYAESAMRDGRLSEPPAIAQDHVSLPVQNISVASSAPSAFTTLEQIRSDLGDCTRCELHKDRKRIVFGVGNPKADLMIVGEAPGRDEDLQGEPFVGQAGQLLTGILAAIGLARSDVYICNVVKCRPPNNRPPQPDEIETCSPFLTAQIESVAPKMICTLGKFATQVLLKTERPISALRGNFQTYMSTPLMPTFHPAYLLRNPSAKKDVWEDMKKVHAELCRITGKNLVRKGN